MKRKDLLTKLLLLCVMIVGSVNAAWADTVIKTIDFSQSEWSGVTFSQGNSTTPDVHNGVTFYSKNGSNQFSLSAGVLNFPGSNMATNNYALGFPVTGIVGGIVIIKVYNGTNASQVTYAIKDGGTEFSTDDLASKTDALTYGTPCTIINTGLSNTEAYIYIGRKSSSYKTITKIEVSTIAMTDISESAFYQFYKTSYTSPANLISGASLPSYVVTDIGSNENTASNSSSISSPHDFTGLASASSSTYYYRLKASNTNMIAIGALSHVKSIRLYGNGSGSDGTINIAVKKVSGDGTAMTIDGIDYDNSQKSVVEYSTGDISALDGYDSNTYYYYTITFSGKSKSTTNFSLWGLYIDYNAPSSYTVTYNYNGGSGSIANSTGASITLSDGTGFTAPSDYYTFAGWNTNEHGTGTSYTSGQTNVKADLTLYAVWTQSGTIDDNGGTADGTYTATYNKAAIDITLAPTKAGYLMTGYYEAGTGDALVSTTDGELQTSTTYTDEDGYWTNTGSAPKLYAQWENTHELTVSVNDADMGSAEADETTLTEGSTTTVTATANSGYKFRSWAVSGTGATVTSSNPTTLTMGTADATVTATFSALEHYTITYNKGVNGSGDAIAAGDKTEDVDFTLSSSKYTRSGYLQTGWALTDGGDKAYELGATYTDNEDLELYPYWIEVFTLTFDANGGSGSMDDVVDNGSITLTANAFTCSGYTFMTWNTETDGSGTSYANGASYTLSADATLYAQWAANDYSFAPTETSGSILSGSTVATSTGGTLTFTPDTGGSPTLRYTSNGLELGGAPQCVVTVTLDKVMAPGSVITTTFYNDAASKRGLYLATADGTVKVTYEEEAQAVFTKQYTVVAGDGFAGSNSFKLKRYNNAYLRALTVVKCKTPYAVTHTLTNVTAVSGTTGTYGAGEGTEYIAVFSPNSGYALPDDIEVTIGGNSAVKNSDYTWNPITGTVTVKASSVTGAIVVTVVGETAPEYGLLFSLDMGTISTTYSLKSKEEIDLADYATIIGGEATLINKSNDDDKARLDKAGGGTICFNGNDGYVYIQLRYPLQTGDLVVFENGSGTYQLCFTKTNSRSTTYSTSSNKYTFADTFNDVSTLYVWRISSATYVKSLKIYRNAEFVNIAAACTDGDNYYGTYSNNSAFIVPEDLTVSGIGLNSNKKMVMLNYETDDIVAAGEGVLLTASTAGNHIIYKTAETGESKSGNLLVGSGDSGVEASSMSDTDYYYYRLTMVSSKPGFWWKSDDGAGFDLAANKAYMMVSKDVAVEARGFSFFFDDDETTTSIADAVQSSKFKVQSYYDLQGRKVTQPTKGLYIVNGKKVVVK